MKTARFLMAAGTGVAGKVGETLRHTPWKSELRAETRGGDQGAAWTLDPGIGIRTFSGGFK